MRCARRDFATRQCSVPKPTSRELRFYAVFVLDLCFESHGVVFVVVVVVFGAYTIDGVAF